MIERADENAEETRGLMRRLLESQTMSEELAQKVAHKIVEMEGGVFEEKLLQARTTTPQRALERWEKVKHLNEDDIRGRLEVDKITASCDIGLATKKRILESRKPEWLVNLFYWDPPAVELIDCIFETYKDGGLLKAVSNM